MNAPKRTGEAELIAALRKRCEVSGQRALAKEIDVSPQYINDVLRGRRDVSDRLAEKLGYERVVIYRPIAKPSGGGDAGG